MGIDKVTIFTLNFWPEVLEQTIKIQSGQKWLCENFLYCVLGTHHPLRVILPHLSEKGGKRIEEIVEGRESYKRMREKITTVEKQNRKFTECLCRVH